MKAWSKVLVMAKQPRCKLPLQNHTVAKSRKKSKQKNQILLTNKSTADSLPSTSIHWIYILTMFHVQNLWILY